MSTIRVAENAACVVVICKEQSCVTSFTGILAEQVVDGSQQSRHVVDGHCVLTPQVGLQVGHEESRRHALPGNVSQHQSQPSWAMTEKIVVVATNRSRGDAISRIFERLQSRQSLRKEALLHLPGNLHFAGNTAI